MYRNIIRTSIIAIIVTSLFFLANLAIAASSTQEIVSKRYAEQKDICPVVKNTIKEGVNTREVTRTAIEMGHRACYVVKCAIEGGGDLQEIIMGAIEAGATSDVVSRCAVEAGAEPIDIARILEREELAGLGYTPLPVEGPATIPVGLPGEGAGGGFLSPSSF